MKNVVAVMVPRLWVVALALVALAGCSVADSKTVPQEAAKPQPVMVKAETITPRSISRILELTGEVAAVNTVTIAATVEGPIAFNPWREGDRVECGQKLIEIDRPAYRRDVEAAQASQRVAQAKLEDLLAGTRPEEIAQANETVTKLEEALKFCKLDLERVTTLVQRGGLPGEALDKARVTCVDLQSQYAAAQQRLAMLKAGPTATAIALQEAVVKEAAARVEQVKAKLAEGTIAAPFSGVVRKVHVRVGDLATLKAPLLELSDVSSLVVRFAIPEAVGTGDPARLPVEVGLDAYPGKTFHGKIIRQYPEIDSKTRTQIVEARVVEPVPLVAGMFARMRLALETADHALVIPLEAVLATPRGDKVAFVVQDGKAVQRTVTTGIEHGGLVQVVAGLASGEQVVIAGQDGLKDGREVRLPAEKKADGAGAGKAKGAQQ
jgi:multidrug efflux pump subunit AcrA (membrane-fusion protein)